MGQSFSDSSVLHVFDLCSRSACLSAHVSDNSSPDQPHDRSFWLLTAQTTSADRRAVWKADVRRSATERTSGMVVPPCDHPHHVQEIVSPTGESMKPTGGAEVGGRSRQAGA